MKSATSIDYNVGCGRNTPYLDMVNEYENILFLDTGNHFNMTNFGFTVTTSLWDA